MKRLCSNALRVSVIVYPANTNQTLLSLQVYFELSTSVAIKPYEPVTGERGET
jgi:hypothetical protein